MFGNSDASIDRALSAFLSDRSGLRENDRKIFEYAVQKLSAAFREGHLYIELEELECDVVARSRIVSADGSLPLVRCGTRLYLARYYLMERELAANLGRIAKLQFETPELSELLDEAFPPTGETDLQKEAARLAIGRGLSIITGGPGTGKTTIIIKIVKLLQQIYGEGLQIALGAPTGKAAMRMRESLTPQLAGVGSGSVPWSAPEALTLHRLLGLRGPGSGARFHAGNRMMWDAVIVDEASMVDLVLMNRLVSALRPNSRLILLGDKDQLASVESGAVLADCIDGLPDNVVQLEKSYRFNLDISGFAESIKRGHGDGVWEGLQATESAVGLAGADWLDRALQNSMTYISAAISAADPREYPELFRQFRRYQVLCAVKNGPRGMHTINSLIERELFVRGISATNQPWYTGRPVIISRNDYSLGLFNGDIGLCLPDPARDGALCAWFERTDGSLHCFLPSRLPSHETVWAMTIHKSQGSEFEEVLVVLPQDDNRVLCRELLYTAVTRSRKRVSVLVDQDICRLIVSRKTTRFSALGERILETHS